MAISDSVAAELLEPKVMMMMMMVVMVVMKMVMMMTMAVTMMMRNEMAIRNRTSIQGQIGKYNFNVFQVSFEYVSRYVST